MKWSIDGVPHVAWLRTRYKRGQGLGEGTSYVPWVRVRDINSFGTSGNPTGIVIPRTYELLSEPEQIFFHLLERDPDVVDIKEQFPILDLASTIELCAKHGVVHSRKKKKLEPFTIDFLVTKKLLTGDYCHFGRSVKTEKDDNKRSVQNRLRIEYEWCTQQSIPWARVDTKKFNRELLGVLEMLRSWYGRYAPTPGINERFTAAFWSVYRRNESALRLMEAVSNDCDIPVEDAWFVFLYCAWAHLIPIDLTRPLALQESIVVKEGYGV